MPTTYTLADADVTNLLYRVMSQRHPRLADAEVKVGILMARNADGPALMRGGYETLGYIKPVPLKDRLTKGYDAELVIDAATYENLRSRQQESFLSHELSHINTIDDDESQDERVTWKTDDLGRPKLKSVPGDWNAGDGFAQNIAHYGADAIEYEIIARCKSRADQARRAGETGQEV
jgi:hypothetical protein